MLETQSKFKSPFHKVVHPMVIFSEPTWTSGQCLIMLCDRSSMLVFQMKLVWIWGLRKLCLLSYTLHSVVWCLPIQIHFYGVQFVSHIHKSAIREIVKLHTFSYSGGPPLTLQNTHKWSSVTSHTLKWQFAFHVTIASNSTIKMSIGVQANNSPNWRLGVDLFFHQQQLHH